MIFMFKKDTNNFEYKYKVYKEQILKLNLVVAFFIFSLI
jgi:hypothetical protein